MIIEEEQAINIYPVDDTAGLTRDLIIKYNNGRKKKMMKKYYRLNTQNQLKTNYVYYTTDKLH